MTTIILNSLAAAGAAIGIAFSSISAPDADAYEGKAVTRLSETDVASHALHSFMRADRDMDQALDVDEFAALSIVTAELAHLNGFIAIDNGGAVRTIALPVAAPVALSATDHTRIDAVARHTFYAFAGDDSRLDGREYVRLQNAVFEQADLNGNGALVKKELDIFAQRQAQLSTGV